MIPYFAIPPLDLGIVVVRPFGAALVVAVVLGLSASLRLARQDGDDPRELLAAFFWATGSAFVVAHVVELVFYEPDKLRREGLLSLLKIWDGVSSMGGFLGATVGFWAFFYSAGKKSWLRQADQIIHGVVVGWIFGRLGCALVHDHPGRRTDFFMGVDFPDGVRHDLGLYEMLYTAAVIFPAHLVARRFVLPAGSQVALVCLLYAPARFGLDFLRKETTSGADPRFWGLTVGQYGSFVILALGVGHLVRAVRIWRNISRTE